jgi:hypothetical protein
VDKKEALKRMKKIFLLIALCHAQSCFAQGVDSLIDIKGYYITRYLNSEIVFSYEQNIKREKRESYSTPIDYTLFSFFIPVQVGNKIVCENDMIAEKFLNYVQNDSIYIISHGQYNDLLKKINAVTADVSKETVILSEAMRLSPYYEIIGNNNFLFKFTYIEGYAQHIPILQIEEKWQNYLWNMFSYNKKAEEIEFFFIVKIYNYTPYIDLPQFKKWLPYLE